MLTMTDCPNASIVETSSPQRSGSLHIQNNNSLSNYDWQFAFYKYVYFNYVTNMKIPSFSHVVSYLPRIKYSPLSPPHFSSKNYHIW